MRPVLAKLAPAFFLIGLLLGRPVFARTPEQDQSGPGIFYFTQYFRQPWREPDAPKKLLRKSGELLTAVLIAGGWLVVLKKRHSRRA